MHEKKQAENKPEMVTTQLATRAVTGLLVASKHSGVLVAVLLITFFVILARFYTRSCCVVAALPWVARAAAARVVVTLSALVVL
jgi:hypothetical protein